MEHASHPVFLVVAAAVVAPLLAEMRFGKRVPVVVLEVLLGILVGPHVLSLVRFDAFLETMLTFGMAAVLFMAGMELDFNQIRGRPVSLAARGWIAAVAVAFLAVAVLHVIPGADAPLMVAIALATTSLGTLLPILRDGGMLDSMFGRLLVAAGTFGEVGPIVAVSLALSTQYSSWQEFGLLLIFLVLVATAAAVGMGARPPKVLAMLTRMMGTSTQLPVRLALLLLAGMFVLSEELGFEGILGAFAAGMVVGLATRGEAGEPFRVKVDAVCFGWFTPFFFVGTGISFDLAALTRDLATMLLVPTLLVLFLAVHAIPLWLYRKDIPKAEQLPFALFTSVPSLGLIVVITQIGLRAHVMNQNVVQALIGAALLSSLLYPTLARVLLARTENPVAIK